MSEAPERLYMAFKYGEWVCHGDSPDGGYDQEYVRADLYEKLDARYLIEKELVEVLKSYSKLIPRHIAKVLFDDPS